MKLYLSSYFLGSEPAKFAELFGDNKKVAIIMNAADIYGPTQKPDYLNGEIAALGKIGLNGEELDLRNFFGDPSGVAEKLQEYGGIWAMGGNSFTLRRAMRQSGFDAVAPAMIRAGSLVYGGFSAGSVVACETLRGIELVDNPEELPEGYDAPVIWEGLGLYDKSIAPHFKSDHPESTAIDKVVAYFETNNLPYVPLRDGEVIVVNR